MADEEILDGVVYATADILRHYSIVPDVKWVSCGNMGHIFYSIVPNIEWVSCANIGHQRRVSPVAASAIAALDKQSSLHTYSFAIGIFSC